MTAADFTPDEREALRLADGETLATVAISGGLLHGVSLATDDLLGEYGISPADEATVEERKEQVRRVFFKIAIYALTKDRAVEVALAKRREKVQPEIRPTLKDCERLIYLAKVLRNRDREDREKDHLVEPTGEEPLADGDPLEALYDITRTGRIDIRYPKVAAFIHEEMRTISFNDTLYVYEDGMYSEDKGRIAARVKEILEAIGYDGPMSTVRREVLAYLLAENPQTDYPFNHVPYHLSVKNGVLQVDPETYEIRLVPHSPDFAFSYQLPVTYDPAADTTFIRQVFEQWVEPEDVPYLLHPPVVAILQSWGIKQKQAFLFEGSHDGGKTTYCEFLYGFFGAGTYSQVDLHRLGEDRFALADLEHKMANIHDEMRAVAVRSAEIFKNLTGGLYHRIERKHENGRHVTLPAVHMFTCNRPPKVDDLDDDAFWSRWVYVVFPNQFPRDDTFKATLCTAANQSAFLNTVLNLVVAVMKDPRALQRMDADEVKQRWTMAADATIKFLWAHFDRDATATIPKEEVYAAYLRYCQENGIVARAFNTFSADLNRAGIVGVRPRRGKVRVQVYQGIQWKTDSPLASSGQGGQGISNLIACEKKEGACEKKEGTCSDHIRINNVGVPPDHPDQPPGDDTLEEAKPGGHSLDKAKVKYSPDPADYADLRRIEFNQRCAACDKQGVVYREKAATFNARRGTAGLCKACYEALGLQEVRP